MNIATRVEFFAGWLPGCEWQLCCWYARVCCFFFRLCCGPFGWRLCPSLLRLTSPYPTWPSVCVINVERGRFCCLDRMSWTVNTQSELKTVVWCEWTVVYSREWLHRIRVSRCPRPHSPSHCPYTACTLTIHIKRRVGKERGKIFLIFVVLGNMKRVFL